MYLLLQNSYSLEQNQCTISAEIIQLSVYSSDSRAMCTVQCKEILGPFSAYLALIARYFLDSHAKSLIFFLTGGAAAPPDQ